MEQQKPQESQSTEAKPANAPERLAEDALVESLMKSMAPEEDKPAKKSEVSTEEAATTTDNRGHLDQDEPKKSEEGEEEDEDEESPDEETEEPDEDPEEDSEESDTDDEADEAEESEEIIYTTPDGEEVTLDELKRGYLRQSDYTKKTQEIAEQRQQAQQAFQALEQHNQVIAEHLSMALSVLEPQLAELAQTDWDHLASTDAYEYAEKKALFEQAQARYQRLTEAAQQTVQEEQARRAYATQQMLQAERQKLNMTIPDLADPKKGPALAKSIKDYALSIGLSDKEASNITDHRLIVTLNKARMYDELNVASLAAAKKKLSKSPKKVARAGHPSSKTEQNQQRQAQARDRVRQSGSVESLVDYLLS